MPCLEGRCASHGAQVPYYLLHDLGRRAWDLPDDPRAVMPVVERHVNALGLGSVNSVAIMTRWLGAHADLPAGVTPEALRQGAFRIVRELLLASTRSSACVVLLENLHWVDRAPTSFSRQSIPHPPASTDLSVSVSSPSLAGRFQVKRLGHFGAA